MEKPEWKEELRGLERTYKNIGPLDVRRSVIESRTEEQYIITGGKEGEYWGRLACAYNFHKMADITQLLGHMCGRLKQRVVVFMEGEDTRGMLEKYLKDEGVKWVNYHLDENNFGQEHYDKFNKDRQAKACLVVRETVSRQYDSVRKQLLARGAEEEMGMEQGAIEELFSRLGPKKALYDEDEEVPMPIITTARHVLWVDAHWCNRPRRPLEHFYHIVSEQYQLAYRESRPATEGVISDWSQHRTDMSMAVSHHFVVIDDPFEKGLLQKQFERMQRLEKGRQEAKDREIEERKRLSDVRRELLAKS